MSVTILAESQNAINTTITSSPDSPLTQSRVGCVQRHQQGARSTPLLPGRGSDYIWSINTHRLWEALCLSLLLPSLCLRLLFRLTPARFTTVWHLVTICQAICLCCHIFSTLNRGGASAATLRPSMHRFIHSWTVPVLWSCSFISAFMPFAPPPMKKACKLRHAGCRCAQWSILIAQESIGIWVRLVSLKGWPEDLALSVLSVTEISTQACIRLMWQSPYCLHANAHGAQASNCGRWREHCRLVQGLSVDEGLASVRANMF